VGSWTNKDGQVIREVAATGEEGKTASRRAAYSKTEDGRARQRTTTGPNGGTASDSTTWTRDGNKVTRTDVREGGRGVQRTK
jgi:hypothetical protein